MEVNLSPSGGDDTGNIQDAIDDVASAGGGIVNLAAGVYSVTGLSMASQDGVILQGEGRNQTSVKAASTGVEIITISGTSVRCAVRDMWLGVFSATANTTGIYIAGTSASVVVGDLEIHNVTFQNLTNPLFVQYCHQSQFVRLRFIQSISGAVSGVCMNLDTVVSCTFRDVIGQTTTGSFGNDFCRVSNDCDTVYLEDINMAGTVTGHGMILRNPDGATGPRLVRARGCFMEICSGNGFYVEGACRDVRFDACSADVNTLNGFHIAAAAGESIAIDGCLSLQNGAHGVLIEGNGGVRVVGCSISDNSQTTDNIYDGVRIANGAANVIVANNRIGDYILTQTNDQRYGISIGTDNTDYITVEGNALEGNQTAPIGNFSTGSNNSIDDPNANFTGTLTGCTTSPTGTIEFATNGRTITLRLPDLSATSNTNGCTITGGPARMWPKVARTCIARITDNGTTAFGLAKVESTGVLTLSTGAGAGVFTATGSKGTAACEITYALD